MILSRSLSAAISVPGVTQASVFELSRTSVLPFGEKAVILYTGRLEWLRFVLRSCSSCMSLVSLFLYCLAIVLAVD